MDASTTAATESMPQGALIPIAREIRILVAGEYPDKGIVLTVEDLERIARNTGRVPLIVEHKPSLVLGYVHNFTVKGNELWGEVVLEPDANSVIERNGLKTVSAGIRYDLTRLMEVSLTATPRIPTARIFSTEGEPPEPSEPVWYTEVDNDRSEMMEQKVDVTTLAHESAPEPEAGAGLTSFTAPAPAQDYEARIQELERKLSEAQAQALQANRLLFSQSVEAQVKKWVEQGKLTPASARHLHLLIEQLYDPHALSGIQFSEQSSLPETMRLIHEFVESLPAQPQRTTQRVVSPMESLQFVREELAGKGVPVESWTEDALRLYAELREKYGEVPER